MSLLMLLLAGGNAEAKKYKPAPRTAKNIVIAHRGYWNTPGAFENSIKAIDNAMNFGIYGSEFDINFTADDSIVVVHGSKHPVVKDLVIQESTFDKVRNTLLGNGEKVPTLREYLLAGKSDPSTQLILEIKKHPTPERENEIVAKTMAMVEELGLEKRVEYISFSWNICEQIRKARRWGISSGGLVQNRIFMSRNILITGGAGFIGSHVVRLFVTKYPDYRIVNLDKLTYAGNLVNLKDIEQAENYRFERCDICDYEQVLAIFRKYRIDGVIHLAAESHVDRSIKDPFTFARTNVMGTLSLLQAARVCWNGDWAGKLFYHISTDEVYGALQFDGTLFTETTKYDPHSPYSASKASSDHFVRAFHDTYGMPTLVTNCSNNYGPYQFPEKLIPLFINNIRHGKPLPVYGRGENVRDWLYVVDHARAIDTIFHRGKVGDTYNIGGFNEWRNIDLIRVVIRTVDRLLGRSEGASEYLITYVTDRAGHDLRYAIDSRKLKDELGWEPSLQFEEGIEKTVRWYLDNQEWMDNITSGEYEKYYEEMYRNR